MKRKEFIKAMAIPISAAATMGLGSLRSLKDNLPTTEKMPVLFIGHGSPMNGILDNSFSQGWADMARKIPVPKAVLVVSAHWETKGTRITAMDSPQTIHDFGGFPRALYEVQYPAPGDPTLAREAAMMAQSAEIDLDHDWGLDHGAWTVVRHTYPDASIPVLQLSIDYTKGGQYHYELATELQALRHQGVLVIGSGNMVHNLRMVAWDKLDDNYGFDWALQMNDTFKQLIADGSHQRLVQYEKLGPEARLAIPTPEHYLPLVYTLGVSTSKDSVQFFNDHPVGGSLTMTSVKFG